MTWRQRTRDVSAAAAHRIWGWMRWAGAIGPQDRLGRRFAAFGQGSILVFPPGDLVGEEHIAIGAQTMVGAHVSLSVGMVPGQALPEGSRSPVLRIGDRVSLGRANHVVAHHSVEIGDDVLTGPHCYITDQNHAYADPAVAVGLQWPSVDAVVIGAGSWLGAGAVVLPGTRLGRNTVVGAGAVVKGEFPDHAVLAGVPAKVVRRWDPADGWQPPLRAPDGHATPAPPDWPVGPGAAR